jgi:spoIIIJ-associated protein
MNDAIQSFLERLVDAAGLELSVTTESRGGDAYHVVLSGPDRGLLLGRNGELLDALEYVVNRAFGRQLGEGKIVLDSGNFRAMREQELRMMAEKAAERVRSSRQPFTFEPMPPSERRVIHVALADDKTVRTESVGNGSERKVKVVPA